MAYINYAQREITLKIVFYGAPFCGRATTVKYIHEMLPKSLRTEIAWQSRGEDRLCSFELAPVKDAVLVPFTAQFQIYALSGVTRHISTRSLILRGVDGIVFTVDSVWDRMPENSAAFEDLKTNLEANHLSLDSVPWVLQYNKRDQSHIAPLSYLEMAFNAGARRVPAFETSAIRGDGVFETLNAMARMLILKFSKPSQAGLPPAPTSA